jgi:hypothetical protein
MPIDPSATFLLGLVAIVLPLLVALSGHGGVWKFLAFICVVLCFGAVMAFGFVAALVLWVVAWIFAAIAQSAAASERRMAELANSLKQQQAAPAADLDRPNINTPDFFPDGVHGGFPYRVLEDDTLEAVMQGRIVRFRSIEAFAKAVGSPP